MTKIRLLLAAVLAIFMLGLFTAPAPAAPPAAQASQAKYADFIQHGPVGNAQGFAVTCWWDGSVKWLYQGQYSQDKCSYSKVTNFYVPAGYKLCVRPYYTPNVGCQWQYSGGTWWAAPSGALYAWTVNA